MSKAQKRKEAKQKADAEREERIEREKAEMGDSDRVLEEQVGASARSLRDGPAHPYEPVRTHMPPAVDSAYRQDRQAARANATVLDTDSQERFISPGKEFDHILRRGICARRIPPGGSPSDARGLRHRRWRPSCCRWACA